MVLFILIVGKKFALVEWCPRMRLFRGLVYKKVASGGPLNLPHQEAWLSTSWLLVNIGPLFLTHFGFLRQDTCEGRDSHIKKLILLFPMPKSWPLQTELICFFLV